ncbi:MAG: hypothetical protein FWF57_03530 [Defluviitaleaceae bacterium]|nr:hypothetical protein [Defluviitaleaceae bacterium]
MNLEELEPNILIKKIDLNRRVREIKCPISYSYIALVDGGLVTDIIGNPKIESIWTINNKNFEIPWGVGDLELGKMKFGMNGGLILKIENFITSMIKDLNNKIEISKRDIQVLVNEIIKEVWIDVARNLKIEILEKNNIQNLLESIQIRDKLLDKNLGLQKISVLGLIKY